MHGSNVPSGQRTAIVPSDKPVVESPEIAHQTTPKTIDGRSVVDDESWFETATCVLYQTKPGTELHYISGFDERSCQRYAAGAVKPPAYFLRRLLRSQQGKQWLAAVMDGCDQQWWLDLQHESEVGRKVLIAIK